MEKAMAPHSSTLAWKITWTEEPGRLQSMGSWRVGHDWVTSVSFSCIGVGSDNPLQYSCLENSHGQEEPGRLQSMGLQRVGQDWAINHKHWTEYLWFWLHQRVLCFKELWRKPFSLRKSNSFLLLPPLIVMVGYKERSHGAHDNHLYMLKVLLYISKYIPGCWSRF